MSLDFNQAPYCRAKTCTNLLTSESEYRSGLCYLCEFENQIEDWGKEFERLLKNQSRDSLLWARCTSHALFSLYKVNIDETYLHTVFANAMMSMHDSIYNNEIKNLEKENAELKLKVEKLKKQLINADKVIDTLILETEHLPDCVEISDKRENLCKCMDRNHYSKSDVIKLAYKYKVLKELEGEK